MKILDYSPREKVNFRGALAYHEAFLLRQIKPLDEENDTQRRNGVSFTNRAPIREKIVAIDQTLDEITRLKKRI